MFVLQRSFTCRAALKHDVQFDLKNMVHSLTVLIIVHSLLNSKLWYCSEVFTLTTSEQCWAVPGVLMTEVREKDHVWNSTPLANV